MARYIYLIQHYVIKFVSDLRWVRFSAGTPVSSTNETDIRDITEIVALDTINSTHKTQMLTTTHIEY